MDKFSDVLNLIWDFVNHPIWFPAALAVVGIIFFVVMFIKANRIVDRHRAEVQQKLSMRLMVTVFPVDMALNSQPRNQVIKKLSRKPSVKRHQCKRQSELPFFL